METSSYATHLPMESFIVRYVLEIFFSIFILLLPSQILPYNSTISVILSCICHHYINVCHGSQIKVHTDWLVPLCIHMCECLHNQMRCLTQMTAPWPQTVCFSINPLSTKCKYCPVAVHHPRVIIFCLWFNKCVPSLDLCLTEGPSTRMLAHGSLKCLHLFLRFQPLRTCSRRPNPSPHYTVCSALD